MSVATACTFDMGTLKGFASPFGPPPTTRPRSLRSASPCLVLPGALGALLVASCATPAWPGPSAVSAATRTAADDDDLWALAPAEAELLVWADMAQLRESAWTKAALGKTDSEERAARAAARGFDEVDDVDRLLYATVPPLREGASILVAQGRMDRERLSAAFRRQHPQTTASDYRGVGVLAEAEEAIAFLTQRTVLSGPLVAVRAAIDCGFGLARSAANESWLSALQAMLREGRGPSRRLPAMAAAVRVSPTMRGQLEAEMGEGGTLEQVGARLDLGRDLDVAMVGLVPTHQQATDLAARVSAVLREQRNRPLVLILGLQPILDGVRLAARENRVEARLSIPEDQRAEIADRMALVAQQIARRRASIAGKGEGAVEGSTR